MTIHVTTIENLRHSENVCATPIRNETNSDFDTDTRPYEPGVRYRWEREHL